MKALKIFIAFFMVAMVLSVPTLAQDSPNTESADIAILATEQSYPDAIVGSSVSEKLGVPVFLTGAEFLNNEALEGLEEYAPGKIVVLGGPEVISAEVVDELQAEGFTVERLWGMSRYGTAQEAVGRFWPEGAEEVVLIEDDLEEDRSDIMATARSIAEDRPIMPVPAGDVPALVLNELNEMDTESVIFIGTGLTEEMENDLGDIGIDVSEEVVGETSEELRENVRERAKDRIGLGDRLLVVATQEHSDVISAPRVPETKPVIVGSEDEIEDVVDIVEESDVEEVMIVGNPELAGQIAEALEELDVEVDLVVERATGAVAQAATLARENRPDFVDENAQKAAEWRNRVEERQEKIMQRAERDLERARDLFEDWNGHELGEKMIQAESEFEAGEYQKTREIVQEVRTEARNRRYEEVREDREEFVREMQRETANIREKVQELTEMNHEFGEEMQDNLTVEERLDVVEDFRNRKRERVQEIVDEMRPGRNGLGPREETDPEQTPPVDQ